MMVTIDDDDDDDDLIGDPCLSSPDPGPCRGSCPRYYFDSSDFTCKKFTYGCCGGNRNNYRTLEDCLDTCNDGQCNLLPNEYDKMVKLRS